MELNHIELAVISETRMTFESEWTDGRWMHVHTGQANHRGSGILCIVSTQLCSAQNLRWRVVIPGRLMQVQIQLKHRSIDVVCCYQHTQAHTTQRRQDRATWWNALDALLQSLASRNTLCLLGDFNTSLMQHQSHAGPSHYRWRGAQTRGAQHEDQGRFMSVLRTHGLVALNTWHSELGPTYIHDDCSSRIDFIITRKTMADGVAKQVKYTWDAPFCGTTGHVPMIGLLRKMWIPQDHATAAQTISPGQKKLGHLAFRLNTDTWRLLTLLTRLVTVCCTACNKSRAQMKHFFQICTRLLAEGSINFFHTTRSHQMHLTSLPKPIFSTNGNIGKHTRNLLL